MITECYITRGDNRSPPEYNFARGTGNADKIYSFVTFRNRIGIYGYIILSL